MTSLRPAVSFAALVLLSTFGLGCQDECTKAWNHMLEVSKQELEDMPPAMRPDKETIDKMSADDPAKRENFIKRCKAKEVDAGCILGAKDTMGYIGCFGKGGEK